MRPLIALFLLLLVPASAAAQAPPSVAPDEPRAKAGEVIVRYRADASKADRRAARAEADAALKRTLRVERTELLKIDDGRSVASALRDLRADPDVAFAQPNYFRYLAAVPNDGDWNRLWGLHQASDRDIDAPEAWDIETGKASVTVAVVDTGIKRNHVDLDDNVGAGWDFIEGDDVPQDLDGHGTHVAGTIGAEGNNGFGTVGVAHDVTLMPLRVFGVDGAGTDDKIVDAFQWGANRGARIVNASLSGPGGGDVYDAVVRDHPNTLFVVAAGNGGPDGVGDNNDSTSVYPCNVTRPNLICVAASDENDARAGFSNYGTTSVDIAAPGTDIWSAWPSVTQLYQDTFESGSPYTTGGTGNAWGRLRSAPLNWTPDGEWVLADSPGGSYGANVNAWAQHSVVSLASLTDCGLGFRGTVLSEPGYDWLIVEASKGAGQWSELARYSSTSAAQLERTLAEDIKLAGYGGSAEFWLRFRFTSDGDNSSLSGNPSLDGAFLDQVTVKCTNGTGEYIKDLQGTSMATPHVAGTAALLLSRRPDLTVAQIRAAILDNGDPSTVPTASGKRLNAYGALLEFVAPSGQITGTPSAFTTARTATFAFTSDQAGSRFECMLDGGAWTPCTSGTSYSGLTHGRHTFRLRTINRSGTVDPTEESHEWVVDLQAPDTTLNAAPPALTNADEARFTYISNETDVRYECAVDAGSYSGCLAAGRTLSGLADGQHTFRVRAIDLAGNVDATPATHTWTIDRVPPETTITGGTSGTVGDPNVGFEFASEAGAQFECRLDEDGWTPCTSLHVYMDVAHGDHTFAVRASDAAGNVDATPATRTFAVDRVAPVTTIASGPEGVTEDPQPVFAFTADDAGATFECRVDGGRWGVCASPQGFGPLGLGDHLVEVRATDAFGNVEDPPAAWAFAVLGHDPGAHVSPTPTPTPTARPTATATATATPVRPGATPVPPFPVPLTPPAVPSASTALTKAITPAATRKQILKAGGHRAAFTAPAAGRVALTWKARRVVVAKGAKRFRAAGTAAVKVALTKKGRALLKKGKKAVKVTATGTFRPAGGAPETVRKTFRVR